MVFILFLMKLLVLEKHVELLAESYLVNMMEYSYAHQNAPLMEIRMGKLRDGKTEGLFLVT